MVYLLYIIDKTHLNILFLLLKLKVHQEGIPMERLVPFRLPLKAILTTAVRLAAGLIINCGALQLAITIKTGNGDYVLEMDTVFSLSPLMSLGMLLVWIIPESQEPLCIPGRLSQTF